jgi:FRG domain
MDLVVKTTNNARDFVDQLRLSHGSWKTANFGDIGFRGQSNSEWQLVPSAFRFTKLGYGRHVVPNTDKDISNLCHGEFMCVKQFLMESDAIGLHIPGDSRFFRDPECLEMPLKDSNYKVWPPKEILETLAIAQHHGVPTRLIDFSYHPMIAAFFAADGAQKRVAQQSKDEVMDRKEKFAVWAANLDFIRQLWNEKFGIERVREVTVSRATNSFLHAQHGLFLLDMGVNQGWRSFGLEPLNQVILGRAKKCVDEDKGFGWNSYFAKLPPLIKFELSIVHANEVLDILKAEGITRAYIYPSYESVVEILKEM